MFVSLKRPGEGRRGEHLHASRSEGKVRLKETEQRLGAALRHRQSAISMQSACNLTEQRLGAALRHRGAERCGEQLVARLHILVASGAEKVRRSLVREGRVRVGGGLGGVVEPGIRGDIRGALRGALSMQSALSVQSAVKHAISGPQHALSPAAAISMQSVGLSMHSHRRPPPRRTSAVQHAISGPQHALSPAAASEEDVSSTACNQWASACTLTGGRLRGGRQQYGRWRAGGRSSAPGLDGARVS